MPNARRVLEIGCGTGAILGKILRKQPKLMGLDIDWASLKVAQQNNPAIAFTNGDAQHLPYLDASLDIAFFHFVLLWLADPVRALAEARRVTRFGGAVIAFAEPDYSQRKTKSPALVKANQLQAKSLQNQGADPFLGSRLGELFTAAGIQPSEFGQIDPLPEMLAGHDLDLELQVLKSDLESSLPPSELDALISELHETGSLATFQVPTFYCWGWVI